MAKTAGSESDAGPLPFRRHDLLADQHASAKVERRPDRRRASPRLYNHRRLAVAATEVTANRRLVNYR
jgi:hypothetical protein